jgi:hypothetical protein
MIILEKKNLKNLEYKIGLRLISSSFVTNETGYICEIKKFHPKGELNIIIEWEKFGKVQYTKTMLDECFAISKIDIDREFYREQKLKELGI